MANRYSPGQGILAPGAPLRRAATLNNILESAEDFQRRRLGDQGPGRRTITDTNRCKVRNNSGADRRRGDLLEFTGFALADEQVEHSLWFTGGSPTLANGFGVLVRATPATVIDDCQVSGICAAWVNVTDAAHKWAYVKSGEFVLQSASSGPVRILHKSSGTGEKMCAVLLGSSFLEIHRGVTDAQINKGATDGVISRYTDGTNDDSGVNDTVTNDWASVGSGKKVIYVKLGSTFYILNTEKSTYSPIDNFRIKAGNTQIEAQAKEIFVDSVATAAYSDQVPLTGCP